MHIRRTYQGDRYGDRSILSGKSGIAGRMNQARISGHLRFELDWPIPLSLSLAPNRLVALEQKSANCLRHVHMAWHPMVCRHPDAPPCGNTTGIPSYIPAAITSRLRADPENAGTAQMKAGRSGEKSRKYEIPARPLPPRRSSGLPRPEEPYSLAGVPVNALADEGHLRVA
jgi:hypothetical protein